MRDRTDIVDTLSKDKKLEIYSLGKQGEHGDCNIPRPGMFDIKGKFKWDAWNARKGEDKVEC